jgi:DNA-binding NarL/FixJ family response regulator
MKPMDGIELLTEIKKLYAGKQYRSILCTASGTTYLYQQELKEGIFHYYLEKPLVPHLLQQMLSRVMEELNAQHYDFNRISLFIVTGSTPLYTLVKKELGAEYNIFHASGSPKAIDALYSIPKPGLIVYDFTGKTVKEDKFITSLENNPSLHTIPVMLLMPVKLQNQKAVGLQKGVIDVITKPFQVHELKIRINNIVSYLHKIKEAERRKIEFQIAKAIRCREDDKFLVFIKKCIKYKISPREKEVLIKRLAGLQNKEIADKLFLSVHTIKRHIRNIYEKCHVQNITELMNLFKE